MEIKDLNFQSIWNLAILKTSKSILKALSKYSELEDHIQAINEKKGNSRCLVP